MPSAPIRSTRRSSPGRAGRSWRRAGARPQRLLWASTGTKNKAYSDVLYVDTLIGPDTVNTMPPDTMDAFRDHGTAKATIEDGVEDATQVLKALADGGISLDKVTGELVEEGVDKFAEAADKLYAALALKRLKLLDGSIVKLSEALGPAEDAVKAALAEWTQWGGRAPVVGARQDVVDQFRRRQMAGLDGHRRARARRR